MQSAECPSGWRQQPWMAFPVARSRLADGGREGQELAITDESCQNCLIDPRASAEHRRSGQVVG